jgi:hypothetical protein
VGQIARCFYYFFMIVVVIRYKTKATARRALTFIVRIFVNDTIAIAVWTSFHVCVPSRAFSFLLSAANASTDCPRASASAALRDDVVFRHAEIFTLIQHLGALPLLLNMKRPHVIAN